MKNHQHPNRALAQEAMAARRLKAVSCFKKQWSERRIAKKFGVSAPAVHLWKVAWRTKGLAGLKAGHYGPSPKLTGEKASLVKRRILEGAETHGFAGDFWTLRRITKAVKIWTGVIYQERSVWHLLQRLGFSCQKPVRRAVERDEPAIRTWLKNTWPLIKKRGLKMV